MPKTEIDYSNTIIYKITCLDVNNKDVYVGHTTNFVQRKHAHKQSCINNKSNNYKCKLYEVIRNNGGWTNWKMEIINFFNCNDHYEARKKEQEFFVSLNATLNSIEPFPKPKPKVNPTVINANNDSAIKKEFYCTKCKIYYKSEKLLNLHMNTKKHKTILNMEITEKFCCVPCNIKCSRNSEWNRHIMTSKHLKIVDINNVEENFTKQDYKCHCGKNYKTHSGLWKHNKLCKINDTNINNPEDTSNNIYTEIMTPNENIIITEDKYLNKIKEMTNTLLEIVKIIENLQKQNHEIQEQMM
jgi:hypothetical protein